MNFTPIIAFAAIALTFSVGDYIAVKTRGVVSSIITAIIVFILLGGVLKFLPADLMEISGLVAVIPTFGMALILTNLGSTLDINELKNEWKTILISLAGIAGIVVLCGTVGQMIFGREYALSSIAPISGGIVATMISSDTANAAGRSDIAGFVASIMAIQKLVGLPISSFCLRKAAARYIDAGNLTKTLENAAKKKINIKFVPDFPKTMDSPTTHFARLSIVAALSQGFAGISGINATICYLIFGALGSATGILEKNCLKKAGGDGVMLLATYAYVTSSFLSMTFSQFANILVPVFGLLILGAIGIAILGSLAGKLLKWDPYLSIATGLSCMFGYPVTYAVAMEVVTGAKMERNLSEEETQRLTDHLLPKMIIAGVTSVTVASVIIADIITPYIFV